jgi:hypothetical protein
MDTLGTQVSYEMLVERGRVSGLGAPKPRSALTQMPIKGSFATFFHDARSLEKATFHASMLSGIYGERIQTMRAAPLQRCMSALRRASLLRVLLFPIFIRGGSETSPMEHTRIALL